MEIQYEHMEVLLITGTSFLSCELHAKEDFTRDRNPSKDEQLEEACWNGILQSMLPEIFEQTVRDNHLYLWEVKRAESFLQLNLGEVPATTESCLSITPYSFLPTLCYS